MPGPQRDVLSRCLTLLRQQAFFGVAIHGSVYSNEADIYSDIDMTLVYDGRRDRATALRRFEEIGAALGERLVVFPADHIAGRSEAIERS